MGIYKLDSEIVFIILLSGAAGACILVGGLLALVESLFPNYNDEEFKHFIIAFGGGILLGAVALVLIPEGVKTFSHPIYIVLIFLFGGVSFFFVDMYLGLQKKEAPQFIAMLLDYIPEAIVLGGFVAMGSPQTVLLAVLIGLQNLPEGFNAFRELNSKTYTKTKILLLMLLLIPLGPIMALVGYFYLASFPIVAGIIMLWASGGILYLMFQDIAPQVKLEQHWWPPLGAVFGFTLALIGHILTG